MGKFVHSTAIRRLLAAVGIGVFLATLSAQPAFALPSGTGIFINVESGKCLDQDYSGGVAHSTVLAFTCSSVTNQKWQIIPTGGYYKIKNVRSGQCLDQDYTSNVQHSGVLAWPCSSQTNQLWDFSGGTTYHLVNYRSGKCVDQNYNGGVQHSQVLAFTCRFDNGLENQYWAFG